MKKVFLMIVLFFLVGCAQMNFNQTSMQEDMPEDFDFSIQFGINKMNEINTYENSIKKDLIDNGTATASFAFTKEEKQTIYEMMKEIAIIEDKKLKPLLANCHQEPYEEDAWKITMNGKTYRLNVSEEYCELTDDAKELFNLRHKIFRIVRGKGVYKDLPDAVGGYD